MDNHTLTVIPGTWTVDEFDKRVRGLRAALIAYGDVFKVTAAPAPTPVPVAKKPRAKPVGERLATSYHKDILSILTRLKVGEKLVDAKAVATLYRSHISGGAIALLVLAVLLAVIAALWVSQSDTAIIDWITNYWQRFSQWLQNWVT